MLRVFDTYYSKGVLCVTLFHHPVKLTIVLEVSLDPLEIILIRHIWDRHRNLYRYGIGLIIQVISQCSGHHAVILQLQAQKNAVIAHCIEEDDQDKCYGSKLFQTVKGYNVQRN